MPKKSSPTPPTATVPHRKPWLLIIFASLVVLVVGFLFGWQWYQGNLVAADKARFAQAERDIDDLSRQIVAATGQPAKVETEKYCSRPNIKFEEGPLSCDIHWYGYYEIGDAAQATTLYKQAREVFTKKWPTNTYTGTEKFSELDANETAYGGDNQTSRGAVRLQNGLTCSNWNAFYVGTNEYFKDLYNTASSSYVLVVEVSCGDKAKIEHFPMKF